MNAVVHTFPIPSSFPSIPIAKDLPEAERLAKAAEVSALHFEHLAGFLGYLSPENLATVRRAWEYADQAHRNQWRSSGDPYITHPIAVTGICANWKLDTQALCAALLHDAMEDCGISKEDIAQRFDPTVADLVDGLTKLDKLHFNSREESQAESFRKMLLAMAKDVRVILVKLADRTHNMRTMGDMPRSKWGRISSETLEIFAPIAHRLGLNQSYRELEELAFRHLHPWRFETLEKAISKSRSRRRGVVQKAHQEIQQALEKSGLQARLSGRENTLSNLYQKMQAQHQSFAQVTDTYGFRLILPSITDCYTALGVLHQLYKPVPGRFKDYIAIAKSNGYQSLHTTLVGPSGLSIECQLRTEAMHIVAEAGITAHWLYQDEQNQQESLNTQWLQSLLDIQNETRDASEFWDNIKVDLFPDSIYVFTPKSKVFSLPQGATALDFAYALHSNIGHHATSAHINQEPASLRSILSSGDVVEIITDPEATPSVQWLQFVKTGRARSKIRNYLKTVTETDSSALGEQLLLQALREEGIALLPAENDAAHASLWQALLPQGQSRNDWLAEIGLGKQVATVVAQRIASLLAQGGQRADALLLSQQRFVQDGKQASNVVLLDGHHQAATHYAECCRPVPGDSILGYLGHGDGLHIHNAQCSTGQRLLERNPERQVAVEWGEDSVQHLYNANIQMTAHNGKGALARITQTLADADADIRRVDMEDESAMHTTVLRFVVGVHHLQHLENVLRALRRNSTIANVQRGFSN